jgi:dTDP-4-dehydrorhamnose reductase
MTAPSAAGLQLWAGPECTVNRVGERWFDQLAASGFDRRLDDLDRLASLGISHLRLPLLWERCAPDGPDRADWAWVDARLQRLRALGVQPIAGLVHHGSGPAGTDLLDPGFAEGLAAWAGALARRHPDIAHWTPVNEPLTTARFSGLYGLWWPHGRDDATFVRCLLTQVQATAASMRAVRAVNPQARLVQTDDLGWTTAGSDALQAQADFENERRWLGWDLLCGRVRPGHALWDWLLRAGARAGDLLALADAPCPPDVVGINSYVTSERFLDDRLVLYPPALHGGNDRQRYVDVETVRVHGAPLGVFGARLREAWDRYRLPLALTEVHLGCTRDEQLRWLRQGWDAAVAARAGGIDVRAVTLWAAFGTFDWDSLLTRQRGRYEPGAWDVRTPGAPRETALAGLARTLAREGRGEPPAGAAPVLHGPGWWQRDIRIEWPVHGPLQAQPVAGAPLLITGATGTLGRAFARLCALRGLPHRLLTRQDMDIADAASVEAALERWQPWAVVNTAGYVKVDEAEADARCWRENVEGPAVLAAACARRGIRTVHFSSDLVFDGRKGSAYVEGDAPRPLNAYGRSKAASEALLRERAPDHALVVRTAAFFGPWDAWNFVTQALAALRRGEPWRAADDQWVSPTYVPDLVHGCLDLLLDGEAGLVHLANRGALRWVDLAHLAAEAAGLDRRLVQGASGPDLGQRAPRPRHAALGSERVGLMPTLDDALARYLRDVEAAQQAAGGERLAA